MPQVMMDRRMQMPMFRDWMGGVPAAGGRREAAPGRAGAGLAVIVSGAGLGVDLRAALRAEGGAGRNLRAAVIANCHVGISFHLKTGHVFKTKIYHTVRRMSNGTDD